MLPPAPPNFHRIAWHGISFLLPLPWNLAFHAGTPHAGTLLFNDLRTQRLEVRWKTPTGFTRFHKRDPFTALETLRKKLAPHHPLPPLANHFPITENEITIFLIADARRLYELHFPSPSEHLPAILADFLSATPPLATASHWPWSIYGAIGLIPARARLANASLLPGCTQLSFTSTRKMKTTLGSYSMADRLLTHRSLRAWATATFPLLQKNPTGAWTDSPAALTFTCRTTSHPFLLPLHSNHHFTFTHNPAANLIHWTHHTAPAHTKETEFTL